MRYQVHSCFLAVLLLLASDVAQTTYNANITGVVSDVATYEYSGQILIRLQNQPTSHPQCSPTYFAIDETTPEAHMDRMVARVLTALATGQPVTIGYDNAGNCAHSFIRIHRIG
jgi:hypothetical protein